MTGTIRRPTIFDIDYLAVNARQADKDEAFLFSGRQLRECLDDTPNLYNNSYVWDVNDKIVCIYGVTDCGNKVGVIWFLATDEFDKHKKELGIRCKKIFKMLIKDYEYIFNYIHVEHKKAIKWVKWLGCTILAPEPIGIKGDMFCKFEVRNV